MSTKTSTFPPVRVAPELREAAEGVLAHGETLSAFVEASIRAQIDKRNAQREFIARGLAARELARETGEYVSSRDVVRDLKRRLDRAKVAAAGRK